MTTWVLLRGLIRESRHWGGFLETARAHWPEARIVTVDWPGNGALHAQESLVRIEDMVAHVRDTLQQQGETGPFHVLAISLGAMVAVAWADAWPAEIAACVLVNTSLRPFSPFYHRLRPRNYATLLAMPARNALAQEQAILRITTQTSPTAVLEDWLPYRQQYPVGWRNAIRQIRAAATYRAPRQKPAVPMLLLCGGQDQLVDPRCSTTLAQAWQAPCVVHPTAGHDLSLDDGAWVLGEISCWMAGAA
ncbi:alpha/beta fold hydrolase [Andreprevotia chitinilytica]|uniref:alpha/beta fold hydrolase n=1 Tax=Andreprevotia chitinilytica TaxID=396808 RepID=UPI0005529740|nr:alpha/beta hydrolase [Andreprevotia chitinilytica]